MEKPFDRWNDAKKGIHAASARPFYHEREIWWCSLGINIGFEQDGGGEEHRRPVIILRGHSAQTCLVVPLTTSTQEHPLRPSVGIVDDKEARVLLSQMRVIDTKRLVRKIGYLDRTIFERIRKAAKDML